MMFRVQISTITLLKTGREILGHGPIYKNDVKIAIFTDYPERVVCVPSFYQDDAYGRFLAAARERFAGEPDINRYARRQDDDMAISEYARQLMSGALDEGGR